MISTNLLPIKPAFTALACFFAICLPNTAKGQAPADMQRIGALIKQLKEQIAASQNLEAAATIGEAIAIGERVMGKGNADIVRMGNQRAVLLRNAGELDAGLRQANNTRRSTKRHLGAQHPIYAAAHLTAGSIYRLKGDFEKAKSYYAESIESLKKAGQVGEKDLADAYANMADVLGEMGDAAAARKYGQQALELASRSYGSDSVQAAAATNNLGMALMKLGDMDTAESTLKKALAMYEKIYGTAHLQIASSLNNLGLLYMSRGRYEEAADAYKRAAKISDATLDKKSPLVGLIKNNLGQMLSELGKNEEALPLLKEALKLRTELLGDQHPSVGTTLHNLGCVLADRHDFVNGRQTLTKAIGVLTAAHGEEHPAPASSWAYLGMLETADGNTSAAIEAFEKSRTIAMAAAWKELPQLNSNDQQNFMKRTFNWTLFTSLALASKNPDDQSVLERTAVWLANGKGIAETALAAARSKRGDVNLKQATLQELRAAIPDDGVFIDIIRQDLFDYNAAALKDRLLDPHYIAWIIPSSGDIARVDLGDAQEIETLIDAARNELTSAAAPGGALHTDGPATATKRAVETLDALANVVWKPVAAKIDKPTRRLIISPDGATWLVPWNALPVQPKSNLATPDEAKEVAAKPDERGYRWLIEQYAISTTASGRELTFNKTGDQPNKNKPTIFSDPDFDQSPSDKKLSYERLFRRRPQPPNEKTRSAAFDATRYQAVPLPGTAKEAAAIIGPMTTWLDGVKPDNFRGRYALESVAKQLVRPRSLVFATHGFFTASDARSNHGSNSDSNVDSNEGSTKEADIDPLRRCGLLLSGCNDRSSAISGDDGILTGVEITEIDLRSTELVVLSACETGVGKIENGNGVAGLRRAFHLAGAMSVASTLWQIPDKDTADLMSDFFARLADGAEKDDALQAAQIKLIEERRTKNGAAHPFFWAGFGLNGR